MSYGGAGVPEIEPDLGPSRGQSQVSHPGRPRGGRSVWIAVASTVVFFAVVAGRSDRQLAGVVGAGWREGRVLQQGALPRVACRRSWTAFWLNVRIFLTAEVLVLIVALVLAVMRSLPGPVFAPLRSAGRVVLDPVPWRADDPGDLHPGFGMPALELQGVPNSEVFWAIVALTLVYTAYVAEVYRAGIESVHPSQTAAARSLGLSGCSRCASSCCRRPSGECSRHC